MLSCCFRIKTKKLKTCEQQSTNCRFQPCRLHHATTCAAEHKTRPCGSSKVGLSVLSSQTYFNIPEVYQRLSKSRPIRNLESHYGRNTTLPSFMFKFVTCNKFVIEKHLERN